MYVIEGKGESHFIPVYHFQGAGGHLETGLQKTWLPSSSCCKPGHTCCLVVITMKTITNTRRRISRQLSDAIPAALLGHPSSLLRLVADDFYFHIKMLEMQKREAT